MNSLKTCLICIVTTFSCATVLADDWLRSVPEFELTDHLGNTHTLKDYEQISKNAAGMKPKSVKIRTQNATKNDA